MVSGPRCKSMLHVLVLQYLQSAANAMPYAPSWHVTLGAPHVEDVEEQGLELAKLGWPYATDKPEKLPFA